MLDAIADTHSAIKLLQNSVHSTHWSTVLRQLCDRNTIHGLLAGRSCRLLLDEGSLTTQQAARRLGLALLLLHDDGIWQVLDDWVSDLPDELFTALLPLLRRTFSNFPAPERRQMGERVRAGGQQARAQGAAGDDAFDSDRAAASLPLIAQLLGLPSG